MDLTLDEVRHIAVLARLGLGEEEMKRLRSELSGILAHVNQLSELDTESIEPTAQVITLRHVTAADDSRPPTPVDVMLDNAPAREGEFFKVRSVLGYET